jgi:uncharacterized protein YjbJ (UPF0337 family)
METGGAGSALETITREIAMNWDQVEGKWKQYKGTVREKWGKLTDSDMEVVRGQRDQLVGAIQERYGIAKEAAQEQVDQFVRGLRAEDKPDAARDRERRTRSTDRRKTYSAGRV